MSGQDDSRYAKKIPISDIDSRIEAMFAALERDRGISIEDLLQRRFSKAERNVLIQYATNFGIPTNDLYRYIMKNADAFSGKPKTASERNETIPRQVDPMRRDSGKRKCKHCNGTGYRQIKSTDKNALPGSYVYGKCPDCGGTGER